MTTSEPPPPGLESALVHAGFVRAMARAVLGADEEVEDVVQGTWLVAMTRGPRRAGSLRAWLGTVARNLAYGVLRRRGSRGRRERAAARAEGVPSVADLVAQEETRRRLFDAVFAMEEPYRSALLLRYQQDLPVAEVARRLGVPIETARTRLQRGLARLRERLDEAHGGNRAAWSAALLPWAARTTGAVAVLPLAGALAMKKTVAIVASMLLLGLGVWSFGLVPGPSTGERPSTPAPSELAAAPRDAESKGPVLAAAPPAAPAGRERRAPAADKGSPAGATLTGHVVEEATGRPIERAQVVFSHEFARSLGEFSGETDAAGAFRVVGVTARARESCFVEAPGYAWTVVPLPTAALDAAPGATEDIGLVKLTRGAAIRGRVVASPGGAGIAGAALLMADRVGGGFTPAFAREVGRSGEGGRFQIDHVPPPRFSYPWVLFAVAAEGLGWTVLPAAAGKQDLAEIELSMRPTASLVVRTVGVTGKPVPGAQIRLEPNFAPLGNQGGHSMSFGKRPEVLSLLEGTVDAQGAVRFDRLPVGEGDRAVYDVVAYAKGFSLAWKDGVQVTPGAEATAEVVLKAFRAASLAGLVQTKDGAPMAGARVSCSNRETAVSGADGTFRLEGLDPSFGRTFVAVEAPGYLSVRRVVLLPKDADAADQVFRLVEARPVAGRVVDQLGKPVAGASLGITTDVPETFAPFVRTDAEGRFRLPEVAVGDWKLHVSVPDPPEGWLEEGFEVPVKGGDTAVEVVLTRVAPGTARVHAVVVDAATGAPLAPAEGMLVPVGAAAQGRSWRPPPIALDATGLTAERVKVGAWIVWARVEGRPAASVRVEVREADTELQARIEVGVVGVLAGRVVLPDGRAPAHAAVFAQIRDEDGQSPFPARSSEGFARCAEDGTFRIEALRPGTYRLQFSTRGFLGEADVEVRGGATAETVVNARAAGVLHFHTETPAPEAIAEFHVKYGDGPWHLIMRLGGIAGKPLEDYETVKPGRLRWRARFEAGDGSQARAVGSSLPEAADGVEGEVTVAAGETVDILVPIKTR